VELEVIRRDVKDGSEFQVLHSWLHLLTPMGFLWLRAVTWGYAYYL